MTAEPNDDGSITIHFSGNLDQSNFLYTPEGELYGLVLRSARGDSPNDQDR
ncbi:hypothetical protein [Haloterrigena sp. H1]|uniref:hypothetical protein n=1 Tax=Haloterrigena sp. H1 TaxID=2552943 RepID=UPI0031B8541D